MTSISSFMHISWTCSKKTWKKKNLVPSCFHGRHSRAHGKCRQNKRKGASRQASVHANRGSRKGVRLLLPGPC